MNADAAIVLMLAAAVAVVDWWAVAVGRRSVEYGAKPLTLTLLIGAAVVIDPADRTQQVWFLVALGFSLAGDIALMLPRDRFVAGLSAFLLAHVAYSGGMAARGVEPLGLAVGLALVVLAVTAIGRRIVVGAPPNLRGPVSAYVLVISVMLAVAVGTAEPWIIAGALLFYASDGLIGWTRFVADFRHGRLAVMVTYHLGQAGLVLGLL